MNNLADFLVEGVVQCYGCPIFDRLFQIVSDAAAAVYNDMVILAIIIFCVMFVFFVANAVWQNIKKDNPDPWYQKSVRPVIINSLVALAFLLMGVGLPRFITTATFEPVAQISLIYTQSMLNIDDDVVNQHVTYQPTQISDDGFFRPQLRDKIIMLMKTTITQFQSYMKLGIAVIDSSVTWHSLWPLSRLIKHIILLFVGWYLFKSFFKLFFRFCCYFADIILAMAMFAFFFPVSLVLIPFSNAESVPAWISGLGKEIGLGQFKKLINAIVSLSAAVITYTVIMIIIARFFTSSNTSINDTITAITTNNVFDADLSDETLEMLTVTGILALVYVINFIQSKIPEVSKMIMSAFNVGTETSLSEKLGDDALKLTSVAGDIVKKTGKTVIDAVKTKS